MYASVKRQIPEYIEEFLVYCDCVIDINKQKSCWVLTRNLKFFEFCSKDLVAMINLDTTCLSKIKPDLENYNGPKFKQYEVSNFLPPREEIPQSKISLGKYVFHALNIHKIYVIIQCWDKCVILKRLPDNKGFQIKAEYEDLLSYRIVHGTIKYCTVLELTFQSNEILKTDFEDKFDVKEGDWFNKKLDVRQLLEQIRCAKTELQLHKSITAKAFYSRQNNLVLGKPLLRTLKFEEKQILARCGDIWKRFTVHDDLVIGVPLVNQCVSPSLCIIRNLVPVLETAASPETPIYLQYRLYQLKVKFDQLDDLEIFLESENEQLQEKVWCVNGDLQILPESFAVLLIKLKISQIILLKDCPLILNYQFIRHLQPTSDTSNSISHTVPLQLYLQNLDFQKLLFEERLNYQLKFLPSTLHQDFLTVALTSIETKLTIIFKNCADVDVFETYIQKSLDFLKPTMSTTTGSYSSIFYNKLPYSLWFGCLVLRIEKVSCSENSQCLTKWKIYCNNIDKTLVLIKTFLSEQLVYKCNVLSVSNIDDKKSSEYIVKFEDAIRQELLHLKEIVHDNNKHDAHGYIKNMEKLCQLQLNTDIKASDVTKD